MTRLLFLFVLIPQSYYDPSWTHTRKPYHSPPLYHNFNIVYASIITLSYYTVREPYLLYKTALHEDNLMHLTPPGQSLAHRYLLKNLGETKDMHEKDYSIKTFFLQH